MEISKFNQFKTNFLNHVKKYLSSILISISALALLITILLFKIYMNVEDVSEAINNTWGPKKGFLWIPISLTILNYFIFSAFCFIRLVRNKKHFKKKIFEFVVFTIFSILILFFEIYIPYFWLSVGTKLQILIYFLTTLLLSLYWLLNWRLLKY